MAAHVKPAEGGAVESHEPYVSAATLLPEFTIRAVALGAIFGVIFGASTVYLGLKVGLTVSASIPIAVLAITILRAFGRASILENNIVQTTGSAGESIAAGIVFTIPALLILGLDIDILRTSLIAAAGGLLGVLLMIPLRRSLIVKEHGNLAYPEGTACAEVLIVGEKGGSDAQTVFLGFGVGLVYKFLMAGFKFWKEVPAKVLTWFQGARVAAEISPELLGVGYIIGPRVASYMLGGGVIAALVLTPLIKFFGAGLQTNIFPAPPGELIGNMSAALVFDRYVRYIAAGAVATGGIISLVRSLPTIVQAFKAGVKDFGGGASAAGQLARTERDLPIPYAMGGVIALLIAVVAIPKFEVDLISALMILIFGFFFVTVSSRICGQIGSTSNPISGMTIATLLFTSLIFLLLGRMSPGDRVIALTVGAIVCVAAANAGNTSQDLKTGFLVGATPKWQQIGLLVGVQIDPRAKGQSTGHDFDGIEGEATTAQAPANSGTAYLTSWADLNLMVSGGYGWTSIGLPPGYHTWDDQDSAGGGSSHVEAVATLALDLWGVLLTANAGYRFTGMTLRDLDDQERFDEYRIHGFVVGAGIGFTF